MHTHTVINVAENLQCTRKSSHQQKIFIKVQMLGASIYPLYLPPWGLIIGGTHAWMYKNKIHLHGVIENQ